MGSACPQTTSAHSAQLELNAVQDNNNKQESSASTTKTYQIKELAAKVDELTNMIDMW